MSVPTGKRARAVAATAAGLATWTAIVWLAGLFIPIPAGAWAFVAVFMATLGVAGVFLPLSGFGSGSAAIGVALIAGATVALGVMNTPLWPLLLGVTILMIALTPSLMIAMLVLGE